MLPLGSTPWKPVTLCDVHWLKLATADAAEGKPDEDVALKAAVLYQVHDRAQCGSFRDVIA